jgi:hypothetical protein
VNFSIRFRIFFYVMKRAIPILSAGLLILASGCRLVNPVSGPVNAPVLSRAAVPGTLHLGDPSGMRISVRASDPQGIGNLESVRCFVFASGNPDPVFTDTLRDDGMNGDVIPGDGEFSGRIAGSRLGGRAGAYRIAFLAFNRDGLVSDTLAADFRAEEGTSPSAPVIVGLTVPDSLSKDDLGSVHFSVQTEDPDGSGDVDSAFCDVYPPLQPKPIVRLALSELPLASPLPFAVFGFTGDLSRTLTVPGPYAFRFQARDRSGLFSVPKVAEIMLILPNQPPVLSELTAPDTVSRRNSSPILLSVRASDPQGPADIRRVVFNTIKPDGTPAAGNPFSMFDDGTNGDVTAGDGVYSLGITISNTNALGNYRFDFFASDLAGAVSEVLTHVITVTDQIPD